MRSKELKNYTYSDYLEIMIPFRVTLENGDYEWHEPDLMYYHIEDEEQPSYDYDTMMQKLKGKEYGQEL